MTPLDALKAGIKSAVVTFLLGIALALSGLVNEVNDFVSEGNPIDLSVFTAAALALAGALGVGVLNALMRYVQVAGVPFLAAIVDRLLGAVPAYPEAGTPKVVDPPPTIAEQGMRPKDTGDISVGLIVVIVCIVVAVLWVVGVAAPWR